MVQYRTQEFKTVLNKLKFPDSWFWVKYTINPYSGCQHACIYCDARSDRYYLQDFENEVVIKENADKKLDLRIKRARTMLPDVIGAGGVNDGYQQIEEKVENTRKILKVIAKYKYPLNIATKSKLVTRDIDLLKQIADDTWCAVGFSISTINQELAEFLEPYSSKPSERLDALKVIKVEAPKVQVGTYFIPIIPFLEDDDENLEAVIKKSKEVGADFVLFSPGLTLRDTQAQYFVNKLKSSKYKDVVKSILELFQGQQHPNEDYCSKINKKLLNYCKQYKISFRIKRWIPSDYRKWNYKISELLLNKAYEDEIQGISNSAMKWAGVNLNNLELSILDVYEKGELSKLRNFNKTVVEFVEPLLKSASESKKKAGLAKFL